MKYQTCGLIEPKAALRPPVEIKPLIKGSMSVTVAVKRTEIIEKMMNLTWAPFRSQEKTNIKAFCMLSP